MKDDNAELLTRLASALEQVLLSLLSVEERLTSLEQTIEAIYDPTQRNA